MFKMSLLSRGEARRYVHRPGGRRPSRAEVKGRDLGRNKKMNETQPVRDGWNCRPCGHDDERIFFQRGYCSLALHTDEQ